MKSTYGRFPNFDEGKWQVSTAGGLSPVWSPDGQELFYRTAVGLGGLVMAVPVHIEPSFTYDAPQRLFSIANYRFIGLGRKFDISPDGQRFVFLSGGTVQIGEGREPVAADRRAELARRAEAVSAGGLRFPTLLRHVADERLGASRASARESS